MSEEKPTHSNPFDQRYDKIEDRFKSLPEKPAHLPINELRREVREHNDALSRWSLASLIAINGGAIFGIIQIGWSGESSLPPSALFVCGIGLAIISALLVRQSAIAENQFYLEHLRRDNVFQKAVLVTTTPSNNSEQDFLNATVGLKQNVERLRNAQKNRASESEFNAIIESLDFKTSLDANMKLLKNLQITYRV